MRSCVDNAGAMPSVPAGAKADLAPAAWISGDIFENAISAFLKTSLTLGGAGGLRQLSM